MRTVFWFSLNVYGAYLRTRMKQQEAATLRLDSRPPVYVRCLHYVVGFEGKKCVVLYLIIIEVPKKGSRFTTP